jgi:hypothetical protein
MGLDDLGRYPVGKDLKVIKIMHFGTHYPKELPSHCLVTKESVIDLNSESSVSMPIITICFDFTSFLIKRSFYKYLLHDTNYGSN